MSGLPLLVLHLQTPPTDQWLDAGAGHVVHGHLDDVFLIALAEKEQALVGDDQPALLKALFVGHICGDLDAHLFLVGLDDVESIVDRAGHFFDEWRHVYRSDSKRLISVFTL